MTSLKADNAPISILFEYVNFIDIFSKDLIVKLPKYIINNNYTINLVDS